MYVLAPFLVTTSFQNVVNSLELYSDLHWNLHCTILCSNSEPWCVHAYCSSSDFVLRWIAQKLH